MVTVENRDELAFRILQRIVDITGLGMFVAGTRDVMYADIFRELAKLFATTVIKDPDIELILRPVDTLRSLDGIFHHAEIFVVGRHEDIHRRPFVHIFR